MDTGVSPPSKVTRNKAPRTPPFLGTKKHVGVSKNSGTPKWMVYNEKPYEQMDDLGGFPTILGNTHVGEYTFCA